MTACKSWVHAAINPVINVGAWKRRRASLHITGRGVGVRVAGCGERVRSEGETPGPFISSFSKGDLLMSKNHCVAAPSQHRATTLAEAVRAGVPDPRLYRRPGQTSNRITFSGNPGDSQLRHTPTSFKTRRMTPQRACARRHAHPKPILLILLLCVLPEDKVKEELLCILVSQPWTSLCPQQWPHICFPSFVFIFLGFVLRVPALTLLFPLNSIQCW